ncbi:hypothetical protein [Arthrobacter sp. H5]|uniref:hypothetical protein n=1 Tax=Arthrobacter sp. H5 TaxID=1267973 RepID=UPI0004B73C18|nr:hypothetical protein [Arthrobacter sp. H5]
MKRLSLLKAVNRLENAAGLDPLANGLHSAVTVIVQPRWLRDVLAGFPIAHPLHPFAAQVPTGQAMGAE